MGLGADRSEGALRNTDAAGATVAPSATSDPIHSAAVDAALAAQLAEVVGDGAVDARRNVVRPGNAAAVAAVCRLCAAAGVSMAVCSDGGERRTAPRGPVLIDLAGIDHVAVEPRRLVARAGAGAALEAVVAAAAAAGMEVAAPPTRASGPMGAVVARGALPRRALCGIEVVLPSGERVVSGGEIQKDVAGYDLAGVMLGSGGRLGLVTEVVLRLLPAGARRAAEASRGPGPVAVSDLLLAAFDPQGLLRSTAR